MDGGRYLVSQRPVPVARFGDALLRGELAFAPTRRRQLIVFVPATGSDGYGLGPGKVQTSTGDGDVSTPCRGSSLSASVIHRAGEGDHRVSVLSNGECPGPGARGVAPPTLRSKAAESQGHYDALLPSMGASDAGCCRRTGVP